MDRQRPADRETDRVPHGPSSLERLAALAEEAGAPNIAAEARALREKTLGGRYYVACVGQFKRGKSTLLDALLGEPLLPIGVLPVTSVPTVVCYGTERVARVRLKDGDWKNIEVSDLEQYVSEAENPENAKQVAAVEVFLPDELLIGGMCLVDTPGIGSVFEANTAATQQFVPHIDAALVVVGADPPISGEELALIERISRDVPDTIFVLNKADRVSPADRSAAKDFATSVLSRRLGRRVEIFEVSAREKLDGTGHLRDWLMLESALGRLGEQSGKGLVEQSQKRGTGRLASWLLQEIQEQRTGLLGPVQELEERVERLNRYITYAEQALRELSLLLTGEQLRLTRALDERRIAFVASVVSDARRDLVERCSHPIGWGPEYRSRCMRGAQDITRDLVTPWLSSERALASAEYLEVRKRFTALANDFLTGLARSGVPEVAHFENALNAETEASKLSGFFFHEIIRVARPASPFRHLADVLLAATSQHNAILRDAERFLDQLLEVNTSRVQRDIEDRLAEDRRHLETTLRKLFQETKDAAERTLRRVRETKSAGKSAMLAEVERLRKTEFDLSELFGSNAGGNQP